MSPSLTDLISLWFENPLKNGELYYVENFAIKCGWCRKVLTYIYDDHVWPCSPVPEDLVRLYAVDPEFSAKLENSLISHKCV